MLFEMQQDAENLGVSFLMFHPVSSFDRFPICEEQNRSEIPIQINTNVCYTKFRLAKVLSSTTVFLSLSLSVACTSTVSHNTKQQHGDQSETLKW